MNLNFCQVHPSLKLDAKIFRCCSKLVEMIPCNVSQNKQKVFKKILVLQDLEKLEQLVYFFYIIC